MKIKRDMFLSLIDATPAAAPTWEMLGVSMEELSIEMNPNVVKFTNVLGETVVEVDRYEKSATIEPYKALKGTALFEFLKDIVENEKTHSDLETEVVNVNLFDEPAGGAYPAIREKVVIAVTSYGGSNEALQIPFEVHFTGIRTKGTYNRTTKEFTASV